MQRRIVAAGHCEAGTTKFHDRCDYNSEKSASFSRLIDMPRMRAPESARNSISEGQRECRK
jgi:hypothetical protein